MVVALPLLFLQIQYVSAMLRNDANPTMPVAKEAAAFINTATMIVHNMFLVRKDQLVSWLWMVGRRHKDSSCLFYLSRSKIQAAGSRSYSDCCMLHA
jgi:hypothetical protein